MVVTNVTYLGSGGTQTLIFSLVVTGLLAGLVWLAAGGSMVAVAILAIVGTILVLVCGALIAVYVVRVMNDRAQQQFMDNTQENLGIMQQLQSIQNKQNQTLMQQLGQVAKLPQTTAQGNNVLVIEEGFFDALEG